jgi:hypothetical protein
LIQIKERHRSPAYPSTFTVGGKDMSPVEIVFLSGVIAAFVVFGGVLAWAAHIDYKRDPDALSGD